MTPADEGGVLRLRGGGGGRKRAASADSADEAGPSDAKKARKGGGGGGGAGAGAGARAGWFGSEVVGRSVMVYWKEQKTYYTGNIESYDKKSG
jgi:hypothetical protein